MHVQGSVQQSPELTRAVEKRIKRLLKGRDLRLLGGRSTSALRHEQLQAGEADGNTEHDSNRHMAIQFYRMQHDCAVTPALVSLAQSFRALHTADLTTSADTRCQEQPRTSSRDFDAGEKSSALHGAGSLPGGASGGASRLSPRKHGTPISSCRAGRAVRGGAAGTRSHLQEPATQDREKSEAWLADRSSQLDRQWAARLVASLGEIFNKYATASQVHMRGAPIVTCEALGNFNVGEAPVNKTPSWEFALQQLEGRGGKLTRAGTHTASVDELRTCAAAGLCQKPCCLRSSGSGHWWMQFCVGHDRRGYGKLLP